MSSKSPVMRATFYQVPGKGKAALIAEALKAGFPGLAVTSQFFRGLQPGPAIFYGVTPETYELYKQCIAEGREHYYVDNGYFRSTHRGGDYFRITKNRPQHDGLGETNGKRFAALKVPLSRPHRPGQYVLIAPQSEWWHERHGMARAAWVTDVQQRVAAETNAPIQVRYPEAKKTAGADAALAGAAVVVTHSSNLAVEAVLAGVPVITTHPCAAARFTSTFDQLAAIAGCYFPHDHDRLSWAGVLADNQWNLDEIAKGAWVKAIYGNA